MFKAHVLLHYKYERVSAHGPRDTRGTHLLDVDFLCSQMMFHFCLGYSFAFTDHHNSVLYFYTYDSYDMIIWVEKDSI
jgi:hypothetical protein